MRLTQFEIQGFESYYNRQTLDVEPSLTLLAGRNNVGKSALLRGLRVVTEQPAGSLRPDCEVKFTWSMSAAEAKEAFNAKIRARLNDPSPLTLSATYSMHLPTPLPSIEFGPHVTAQFGSLFLVDSRLDPTDLAIGACRASNNSTALWWKAADFANDAESIEAIGQWVSLLSRLVNPYYMQPRMSGAQPAQFQVNYLLEPNGSNLTTVLASHYINNRRTVFAEIEAFIHLGFPEISGIDVRMQEGMAPPVAAISIVYANAAEELVVPLQYCGTGIEQLLMISTAVLAAKQPQTLLIDEPHAFLHPAAERHLLGFLERHNQHQYIIATHSSVFLGSRPLTEARLVTRDGGKTVVSGVEEVQEILTAIGVTAADLWSTDALMWIEGKSDKEVVESLIASTEELKGLSICVMAMPDWVRAAGKSGGAARSTVQFCEAVQKALLAVRVKVSYVFDGDERSPELVKVIEEATGGHARFLTVRELENFFLVPEVIQARLAELCELYDHPVPTVEEVRDELDKLICKTGDPRLYRGRETVADRGRVVGSAVLHELYWKWALVDYDKVTEAPMLARVTQERVPQQLQELRDLIADVGRA